jgi:hypothetical protein
VYYSTVFGETEGKIMKYQVCRGCGDHLDAGEAVNGYCRECLEEKEKRKDIVYRMQCMVASKDFKQMEMEEFIR